MDYMNKNKIAYLLITILIISACGNDGTSPPDSENLSKEKINYPTNNVNERNTARARSYELGKDYSMVDNPLPIKKDGVVEVAEAFWYGCNHCYSFESTINNWDAGKPDYVKFSKMPITWSQIHQLHASLYHTIEALKLDKGAHTAVFTTIHKENNFLASQKSVVKFLSKLGVSEDKAKQYLNSFGIKQKVSRDNQLSKQLRITSVPMIIVDGKYIIESKPSRQEMLEVLDYVIELQKSNS